MVLIFFMNTIAKRHVKRMIVASLDKTLYDDYLCLVVSNKQQVQWTRIRKTTQEHWYKQVRIPPTTK